MTKKTIRGTKAQHELSVDQILLQKRTPIRSFFNFLFQPFTFSALSFLGGALCYSGWQGVDDLAFLAFAGLSTVAHRHTYKKVHVPMRPPIDASDKDRRLVKAKEDDEPGWFFLGNDMFTGAEIWASVSDVKTHICAFGTTGAGKTEMLVSFVCNALIWGSGFIYTDGKGDVDLWARISAICRIFGRDDDLYALNFLVNTADPSLRRSESNTMNPLYSSTHNQISQLLVSLVTTGSGEGGGSNKIFEDRAVTLLYALIPILVFERDYKEKPLSFGVISAATDLTAIMDIYFRIKHDQSYPKKLLISLEDWVKKLPALDVAKIDTLEESWLKKEPFKFENKTLEQHSYVTIYYSKSLASFTNLYGFIFDHTYADIDLFDVVLNRRILTVFLPSLANSSEETANLGKILVANLKNMLGQSLGSKLEGHHNEIIENRPTKSKSPMIVVFDEVGYYTTEGMDIMAAQARSLNMVIIFAAQDKQAMQRIKAFATVTETMIANTKIKIIGALEDPGDTWKLVKDLTGQTYIRRSSATDYQDDRSSKHFEKAERVDLMDLKNADAGEVHIMYKDKIIRGNAFYANPKLLKRYYRLSMIGIAPYRLHEIERALPAPLPASAIKRILGKGWPNLQDIQTDDLSGLVNARLLGAPRNAFEQSLIDIKLMNFCVVQPEFINVEAEDNFADIPDPRAEIVDDTSKPITISAQIAQPAKTGDGGSEAEASQLDDITAQASGTAAYVAPDYVPEETEDEDFILDQEDVVDLDSMDGMFGKSQGGFTPNGNTVPGTEAPASGEEDKVPLPNNVYPDQIDNTYLAKGWLSQLKPKAAGSGNIPTTKGAVAQGQEENSQQSVLNKTQARYPDPQTRAEVRSKEFEKDVLNAVYEIIEKTKAIQRD